MSPIGIEVLGFDVEAIAAQEHRSFGVHRRLQPRRADSSLENEPFDIYAGVPSFLALGSTEPTRR